MVPDRKSIRVDLQLIADMIEPHSRVLDVGCGEGTLLAHLVHYRNVDGRGIELSTEGVKESISAGLAVIQGDADTDLKDYPDDAFDYVVLSQTLQAMSQPKVVLENLLRISKRAIVSFPNFAHWRARLSLGLLGIMPVSKNLPHKWYDTPNIHLCTISDFVALCQELGIVIESQKTLDSEGHVRDVSVGLFSANFFGEQAVFLLRKN
ncbi:MAG: methionine biosynthesis protein MetW [Rhodospirillales bacterium]